MKSFWKTCLTIFLTISLSNQVLADPIYGRYALSDKIDSLINSVNPNLNLGIQIKSLRTGSTLYSRNASDLFVPASILKIFTAESALLYLGPGYKFKTT